MTLGKELVEGYTCPGLVRLAIVDDARGVVVDREGGLGGADAYFDLEGVELD